MNSYPSEETRKGHEDTELAQKSTGPPKWKVALLAWIGAFPLIYFFGVLFPTLFPRLNFVVRTMVSSMLLIGGLTFFIMPFLVKIFSKWLMK